ncbi:MAG: endolytic transglycosylase MltG [Actinomycetota bacterium]
MPKRSARPPRERRTALVVLIVAVLLLAAIAGAVGVYYSWSTGASGPQAKIELLIPSGATGADVGDLLKRRGVIRSTFAFNLIARVRGLGGGFQAGQYTNLTTNMTVGGALDALQEGPFVESVQASFREGNRLEEAGTRAAEQLGISRRVFIRMARSGRYSLPPYLPEGTKTAEGFLFPNTYDFLNDATEGDVIERLLGEFERQASTLPWDRAEDLGVTPYEVVIIASMVEREARVAEDRAKIARVIYNRLEQDMRLEIDATVQYALGNWEPILIADREIVSPYNTYLNDGLPPGPIASPGKASLEAALNPADGDWLYYVVIDAEGHHAFTASYQEFLRLVDQYQG